MKSLEELLPEDALVPPKTLKTSIEDLLPAEALAPPGGGKTIESVLPAEALKPTKPAKPASPPLNVLSAPGAGNLEPRQRAYAYQQRSQLVGATQKARQLGVETEESHPEGFWKMLEYLDRPRNAMHMAIVSAIRGDRNPSNIAKASIAGLSGEEHAHFQDIMKALGPEFEHAFYLSMTTFGVPFDTARKVFNFGGDMLLDPLLLVPGEKLLKPAFMVVGKGGKAALELVRPGSAELAENFMRQTFLHSTGFKQVDQLRDKLIDANHYFRKGLHEQAAEIAKTGKVLRPKYKGIVSQLAEEKDMESAFSFAEAVRNKSITDPKVISKALTTFDRFKNPEAVRTLISMPGPEYNATKVTTSKLRDFVETAKELQESQGKVVGTLTSQLERKAAANSTKLARTVSRMLKEANKEQAAKIAGMEKVMKGKVWAISKIVGKGKMKEIASAIRNATPPGGIAKLDRYGQIDSAAIHKVLARQINDIQPRFLSAMKGLAADRKLIDAATANAINTALNKVAGSTRIESLIRRQYELEKAIADSPSYIAHVASREYAEKLAQLPQNKSFLGKLFTPTVASDITREWAIKGRSLSFEEIEDVIARGEAQGQTRAVLARGPVIKHRGIVERIKHTPKELAKAFDTDEHVVLDVITQESARGASGAEYWRRGSELFGKTADEIANMTPAQAKRYIHLSSLHATQGILREIPAVKARPFFDVDIANAMIKGYEPFTHPARVLKFYDSLESWYKSMQLVMWPAFHTRNAIGNVLNMMCAGFFDITNPKQSAMDIADWIKSSHLQASAWKKDSATIGHLRFHVKKAGVDLTGTEFIDLAHRRGIVDSGWWATEMGSKLTELTEGIWKKPSTYLPGKQSIGIRVGRATGRAIENNARMTLFASELRKGKSIDEAAANVKRFLGDYRGEILRPFEREFMARVFPFYRWSRYNIPMQIEQMLFSTKSRARTMALLRGYESFLRPATGMDVTDLPEDVPQWIKDSVPVPVRRREDGDLEMFILGGWHPTADVDQILSTHAIGHYLLGQTYPLITKSAELLSGTSLQTGQHLRGRKSEFLGQVMDAEMVNLLRTFRAMSTLDTMDPLSAYHVARKDTLTPAQKALRYALGMTIVPVNQAQGALQANQRRLDRLNQNIAVTRRFLQGKKAKERIAETVVP